MSVLKCFPTAQFLIAPFIVGASLSLHADINNPDIGPLIFEDNFDTLNPQYWTPNSGNGCQYGADLCGWGNQELQWYHENNLSIESVPGNPGNNALVLTAKRETVEQNQFTSGKVDSEGKVAVQYGLIEIRMRVPNLETGLWPAAWMLGTSTASWPAKGEIDMMEMGHRAQTRTESGHPDAAINNYVGANAIFYSEDACVPANPTCAASSAWQNDNTYVADTPLSDRFVTYRTYWTDTHLRFTIIDNGVEVDLYDTPFEFSDQTEEFQNPFYLLLNLAVGGNLTDAAIPSDITAPLPGKMYIDYVRVYQIDGMGEVFIGNTETPEQGTFGVFTDLTPTNGDLVLGETGDLYVWNQNSLSEGNTAPFEGDKVIAWNYQQPGDWFGAGFQSRQPSDMSLFADGQLRFGIKIPSDVSFKIGIADTFTNQNWIEFPAFENKYGLVRDGNWSDVTIPINDLRGDLIALQSLQSHFQIASVDGSHPTQNFELALDNIVWEGGGTIDPDSDNDGVADSLDQCPDTPANTEVDNVGCPLPVTAENIHIEAEDYTSFFDTTPGNAGGAYRTDNVDIERTSDSGNGFNVGWTAQGEWLEYQFDAIEGSYEFQARVASLPGNANYQVVVNDSQIQSASVNTTHGWQNFITQTLGNVSLNNGTNKLRINIVGGEFNLNWIHLKPIVDTTDSDNDGVTDNLDQCPDTPFNTNVDANGCPLMDTSSVTLEAEDYANYFDTTAGNTGGAYRNDDVDIESTQDGNGGFNVGWTAPGEWLEYSVYLNAGTYALTSRVASLPGNAQYTVTLNGQSVGTENVVSTGGWQTYIEQSFSPISVESGNHTLRITFDSGEMNLNWLTLSTETVSDSDNDGVPDSLDHCAGTPPDTQVDNNGCAIVLDTYGITDIQSSSLEFYVQNNGWAIVHYQINNSNQLNVTMNTVAGENRLRIENLNAGDQITYSFTYWDSEENAAFDSEVSTYTHAGDSSDDSNDDSTNDDSTDDDSTDDPTTRDSDNDGVNDANDQCPQTPTGTNVDAQGCPVNNIPLGDIIPLYNAQTEKEPAITFDRGDALVTRFSDRARDRHAKENHFQAYDHYLSFYWEDRTASIEIVDYVAKGGDRIRMNVKTLNKLDDQQAENRWFYIGRNTLAEYCGNGVMNMIDYTTYWKEETNNCREGRPIQAGDKIEFEISQFLDEATLPRGRSNYYGTTYLYIVGQGLVPWDVTDKVAFEGGRYLQRDSIPVAEEARLGGDTTLHVQMTAEPDGHFQQMATNLGYDNGQPFVLGRRVHHSSFVDGSHDENPENGIFEDVNNKAGPHYIEERCSSCHVRNGRARLVNEGEPLKHWVFKVGDASGQPHPQLGRALQPLARNDATSEGQVSIAYYTNENGLRKPNYQFSGTTPETFSARIAPQLNGMGLLEAIPENAILALADENDSNNDGISGKPQRVIDPETGNTRLGRFGYKAATGSLKHQIAAAFNTDMGVMTSVLPQPDCGSQQSDCGPSGSELDDEHLNHLVKYIALLGVRPQRNYNDEAVIRGKQIFRQIGCNNCHVETFQTSQNHPLAELRNQTIHPYTDLLLHDMGPEMADTLGEGEATGREWRTAPLWGVGLSPCVTGGVAGQRGWDAFGLDGHEYCTPHEHYLHDGRARTLEEAILWHGGEGDASRQAYRNLPQQDKDDLITFLKSL